MSLVFRKWVIRVAPAAGLLAAATLFSLEGPRTRQGEPVQRYSAPPVAEAAEIDPYVRAVALVEEGRGGPAGRSADVTVPAQLRHAADKRRFLAVQIAEARRLRLSVPADYADLAELISAGELVELQPSTDGYVLYGVGYSADDGPFTHYDERGRRSLQLFANGGELRSELARLDEATKALDAEESALKEELKAKPAGERQARSAVLSLIAEKSKEASALRARKGSLEEFYKNGAAARRLAEKHAQIERLAADFGGETYDTGDPASRREMKVRMLSYVRPAALGVLEEVGRAYRERFGRPLPVTSAIRPVEYQNHLSRTNSNATRVATPPHATGLAFDIFYRYMDAEEQDFLMAELARMKDAGRIEVLRELRDHFHVYAFAGGAPPDESLVSKARSAAVAGDEGSEPARTARQSGAPRRKAGGVNRRSR